MKSINMCLLLALTAGLLFGQASKKLEVSDFKTSSYCGTCHVQIHAQWMSSTHSKAFQDPIYQTFLRHVSQKTGGRSDQFCISCHAPLATITNSIPANLFDTSKKPPLLEDSVSCEFCHTLSGSEVQVMKVSLGAFLYPRVGQTKIFYGRHSDASTDAHPTQVSKFLLSSEICGTCHRFAHPASGKEIQNTYHEWKQGPYATQGTRCQDCHMPAYPGKVAEAGQERPELHAHVFIGGHTEMIRKAATVNVSAGWKKKERKDLLDVSASITNVGAGHLIPTGIPGIREMWLEVTVFSGQQSVATEKRPIGLELFDDQKKPAMPWDAVSFGKDTRIGPKKTRLEKFNFKLSNPAEVRVEAKLLERLVSETAARYANIPASPPMPMAEASITVP
jgi:hypothetical protein